MKKIILLISLFSFCHSVRAQQLQITGTGSISGTATLSVGPPMGPLVQSGTNSHFVVNPSGQVVYLTGSHTWNDFDDTSTATVPAAFPFSTFVSMLKTNGHSFTILWHKDLPRECGWQNSANYNLIPQPWPRNGPGNASDGLPKFDVSQFNQAFFDRMRSEALTLQQNGIYAVVELFDGNNLTSTRGCGDGFPLTSANNINGIDDGYVSGTAGVGSVTEASAATNPNLVAIQDAYVKKMIDSLNDLQNVLWEVAEEQPGTSFAGTSGYGGASSMTWWAPHVIELVKTYERGGTCSSCTGSPTFSAKPFHHLVGIGSMNFNDRLSPQGDAVLYASTAEWIAPTVTATAPDTFPSNVTTNNQGKLVINDSDHALGYQAFVNTSTGVINDASLRDYVWENYTQQATGLVFMDPYVMSLPINQRNPCASPVSLVCPASMAKYDPFRAAMGYTQVLEKQLVNHLAMTTQNSLCSTGFCQASNTATTSEFVVYAPTGGAFTVNLSAQSGRAINVQWLDPTTGVVTSTAAIVGGSAATSFTPAWGSAHDAVLHLTDGGTASGAGNPQIPATVGWFQIPNTNLRPLCPAYSEIQGTVGCPAVMGSWGGAQFDSMRDRFIIDSGGHVDYFGNEMYSVNMSVNPITVTLLKDATHGANMNASSCPEAYLDGAMDSRHTYNGPWYLYWLDQYSYYGGSKANCGSFTNAIWYNDPLTTTWTQVSATGTKPQDPTSGSVPGAAYYRGDETHTPLIYDFATNEGTLYAFDPYSNVWSTIKTGINICVGKTNLATEIDPLKRIMYIIGQGGFCKISLDSPFTFTSLAGTNCSNIQGAVAPGIKWDPVFRDMALWNGGNTVFFYSDATDTCTSTAPTGGPGGAQSNGTYGRWNYDPQNGVYVAVNTVDTNVWTFRRDTTANLQVTDWNNRKNAAGVIASQDFNSAGLFSSNVTTGTGTYVAGGAPSRKPVQDCTTWTSTGCSFKCPVPGNLAGPDACGSYQQWLNTTFGPGQTLYYSFWQKMDTNLLAQTPIVSGGGVTFFKQVIAATWQGITPDTCDQIEVTTVNDNNKGRPRWYSACGAGNGSQVNIGGSDFLQEEGEHSIAADTNDSPVICPGCGGVRDTGFNCHFTGANNGPRSCANYPANTWVHYYFKITLGTLGTATTVVQAWRQLPGQPRQMWSNIANYQVFANSSNSATGLNLIDLINYYTGRTGCTGTCNNGNTWYSDLLISTTPQVPPMAPVN